MILSLQESVDTYKLLRKCAGLTEDEKAKFAEAKKTIASNLNSSSRLIFEALA